MQCLRAVNAAHGCIAGGTAPEGTPRRERMDSVTVFCGSRHGAKPEFVAATAELGAALARAGLRIVYGGGSRGLMGVLAEAALAEGGEVIGIIPRFLEAREVAHRGLTELVIVDSMQHRKDRL
ncbi:MAG TPA: LOG family protein, partial [Acetobacteraceae bacterium]|nr:LOG family protein [Acetobacteraceae bacterium]